MVFSIDIVVFGITLFKDLEFQEQNVAFVAILFGLILKLILGNIASRTDKTVFLDIFFGEGFSRLFKGDLTYIKRAIQSTLKIQGPIIEFLISLITAFFFPLIGPTLTDTASLQEFLFTAIIVGYSIDIILIQLSETANDYLKSLSNISDINKLVEELQEA